MKQKGKKMNVKNLMTCVTVILAGVTGFLAYNNYSMTKKYTEIGENIIPVMKASNDYVERMKKHNMLREYNQEHLKEIVIPWAKSIFIYLSTNRKINEREILENCYSNSFSIIIQDDVGKINAFYEKCILTIKEI